MMTAQPLSRRRVDFAIQTPWRNCNPLISPSAKPSNQTPWSFLLFKKNLLTKKPVKGLIRHEGDR